MIYRKPLTLDQWRAAAREYDSFRAHVHELRKSFPPLGEQERKVFRRYRDAVHAVGDELKRGTKLRVDELNDRVEIARIAMTEYFRAKQFGE